MCCQISYFTHIMLTMAKIARKYVWSNGCHKGRLLLTNLTKELEAGLKAKRETANVSRVSFLPLCSWFQLLHTQAKLPSVSRLLSSLAWKLAQSLLLCRRNSSSSASSLGFFLGYMPFLLRFSKPQGFKVPLSTLILTFFHRVHTVAFNPHSFFVLVPHIKIS